MHGIASAYLLRFRQKHFGIAQDQIADGRAAVCNVLEVLGAYSREPAADLRDCPCERPPSAREAAVQTDRAFTSDGGGFYGATILPRTNSEMRPVCGK